MNFYENSIRKISKILENNWGEILEFRSRVIGRKKRIMCSPLVRGPDPLPCLRACGYAGLSADTLANSEASILPLYYCSIIYASRYTSRKMGGQFSGVKAKAAACLAQPKQH